VEQERDQWQRPSDVVDRDDRFIDRRGDHDLWWIILARKP